MEFYDARSQLWLSDRYLSVSFHEIVIGGTIACLNSPIVSSMLVRVSYTNAGELVRCLAAGLFCSSSSASDRPKNHSRSCCFAVPWNLFLPRRSASDESLYWLLRFPVAP